jgi:hypothetical protein
MRYLKRFNENYDIKDKPHWFTELEEFCQTSLAYLIDDGYEVDCDNNANTFPEPPGFCADYEGDTGTIINLYNLGRVRNRDAFKWSEIKDYYIPFIKLLSRRYRLLHFKLFPNKSYDNDDTKFVCIHGEGYNYFTLNDLINDDISDDIKIYGISVKVVDKL